MQWTKIDSMVLITTVQPLLILWVAAISFFISLAITAILSTRRRWFELTVIFVLAFVVNIVLSTLIVQIFVGVELFEIEAIETMRTH